jgi:hypothetical protein
MTTAQPLSDFDQMIIEHVTPIIASLPRDKPHLAEKMFVEIVWAISPTVYGQRIAYLAATHRLPLRFHEKTGSNASTYWIIAE